MTRPLVHIVFIVAVLTVGLAIGTKIPPGEWYAGLTKPDWTPSNAVFPVAWTILYVLIGVVGARKWIHGGARTLWWTQMVLNFLWTPVFFGLHLMGLGLAIILSLLLTVLCFIAAEWQPDRPSALMFLPYALWLAIAASLNAALLALN